MAKATTKKAAPAETNKKIKMPNWSNVWKNTVEVFYTTIIAIKVMGVGAGAAYLISSGISKTDAVYLGLGAILAGYAIVVFVSTAHAATKARRA